MVPVHDYAAAGDAVEDGDGLQQISDASAALHSAPDYEYEWFDEPVHYRYPDDFLKSDWEPKTPIYCHACQLSCNSPAQYRSHLEGKQHMHNVRIFRFGRSMLGPMHTQFTGTARQRQRAMRSLTFELARIEEELRAEDHQLDQQSTQVTDASWGELMATMPLQ